MAKKAGRNTKARIVAAAWRLFYEQGYEDTTVEDIVFESETSKGSFYHYFEGKDALLGSLSVLTLVVVPVVYCYLDDLAGWLKRRFIKAPAPTGTDPAA